MAFPGLNAMKYFKLFDGDQEATIGRKTYASFTHYFKDLNAHKDITVSNWLSNPLDYFNSSKLFVTQSISRLRCLKSSAKLFTPSSLSLALIFPSCLKPLRRMRTTTCTFSPRISMSLKL